MSTQQHGAHQCIDCGRLFGSRKGKQAHRGARGKCEKSKIKIMFEIRGLYDGWSYALLENGVFINRWEPGSYRWENTQRAIAETRDGSAW